MIKRWIFIIILLAILLTWLMTLVHIEILSVLHKDEFAAHSQSWVYGENDTFKIKVMTYSKKTATVYLVSDTFGVKAKFTKQNGQWVHTEDLAVWSTQGSADQYFIWPYFKNLVP
jgi:hypothetical protein